MNVKLHTIALIALLSCGVSLAQDAPSGPFAGQVPVNASLKKFLTSKDAKVGQEITATTEKPVTLNNVTLPKGTLLLGHVVDVTKHTKETPNGSLTVVFDHMQQKKGDPLAIRASIYKISMSEGQVLGGRPDVDMGMRGSQSEKYTTADVRETTDMEGRTVKGTTSAANAPVRVISLVPGVALSAVASDTKSGIMTSANKDVELDGGLELVIGVAAK
jgi:uncharacterized protein (DUF2141 family)